MVVTDIFSMDRYYEFKDRLSQGPWGRQWRGAWDTLESAGERFAEMFEEQLDDAPWRAAPWRAARGGDPILVRYGGQGSAMVFPSAVVHKTEGEVGVQVEQPFEIVQDRRDPCRRATV